MNVLGGSDVPLIQNPYHALDLLYKHIQLPLYLLGSGKPRCVS
jgi:hypothetical protein